MEFEVWKDIRGYEGLYAVSNTGKIKNVRTNKVLKCMYCKDKYLMVHLFKNGISKSKTVHRIVALAFIQNPYSKPEVNHKDLNKENNRVDNLEWVTGEENRIHASKMGAYSNSKRVTQIDDDGNIINIFSSIKEAARLSGVDKMGIKRVARGIRNTAGGYFWRLG